MVANPNARICGEKRISSTSCYRHWHRTRFKNGVATARTHFRGQIIPCRATDGRHQSNHKPATRRPFRSLNVVATISRASGNLRSSMCQNLSLGRPSHCAKRGCVTAQAASSTPAWRDSVDHRGALNMLPAKVGNCSYARGRINAAIV